MMIIPVYMTVVSAIPIAVGLYYHSNSKNKKIDSPKHTSLL
jgi:hypothetical protein